ncbi:hypothetical protein CMQ_7049 [Grosmannia clavigera kw1407]|uniref:Uncharacterized protein n=1 Tax=Grosmannia clavigera (strain kw1407 / UAMH 11150) TaxID=655863 RepID=F0XQ52_GROCL|nr:uncharacterized protein CMQ_7049 [Grosmannia clavigera kw1407]EFX00047.1 hypothetical protein CMQ_7049 [Grosmannia clavigera kw1407]
MAPFLSSSRTAKAPKSPKSPGRSLFGKALPTTPSFNRLFSSSSSSVAAAAAEQPALPPLPPPSSNLLDSATYSFVPSAQVSGAPPASDYSNYPAYPSSANTAAIRGPQPPYAPTRRPVPGINMNSTSAASLATSVSSATMPLPSFSNRLASKQLPPQPPQLPAEQPQSPSLSPVRAIRRRPVGRAASETTSTSQTAAMTASPPLASSSPVAVSTSPQLPDLPTSSVSLLGLPELPAFTSLSADVEPSRQLPRQRSPPLPSQLKSHLIAPSPPPRAASPGGASISSILSAYSQSSLHAGQSSASEDTANTNHSSYLAGLAPSLKGTGTTGPKDGDDGLTPLSYLLEEDYGEAEDGSEVTEEELFRHYGQYDPEEDSHASLDASNVSTTIAPPSPLPTKNGQTAQQQQQALPPRSTSLRDPAFAPESVPSSDDRTLPPLPVGEASLKPSFNAPTATATTAPASELWKRRIENADGAPSLPELDLTFASTVTTASGSTFANSNAEQQKQLPSRHPQGPSTLRNQPALPPPLSPLPPPPARTNTDQLHAPPRSPFLSVSPAAVAASSPRPGLPGRDIRPSRQASPAVTPTPVSVNSASAAQSPLSPETSSEASATPVELVGSPALNTPNSSATSPVFSSFSKMGHSFSKFEAKVENKLKRKDPKNSVSGTKAATVPSPAKDVSSSPSPQLPVPASQPSLSSAPPLQRLPTPDYDDEEDRSKHALFNGTATNGAVIASNGSAIPATSTPPVYAPASPATSPTASPASTLGLGILPPPAPFARMDSGQISPRSSPRPAAQPQFRSALPGRDIRPAKNVNVSTVASPGQTQSPQPQQFAPRTSSRKVSFSTPSPRDQFHSPDDASTVSESSSQLTIKAMPPPMQQPPSSPSKPGMLPVFPVGYMSPMAPGTVVAAPLPGPVHFLCLHRHREMFRDRNTYHPLSCQACQTPDRSVRWRCKWCCLRVCTSCQAALQSEAISGDLERLMAQLAQRGSGGGMEPYGSIGQGSPLAYELPAIQEANDVDSITPARRTRALLSLAEGGRKWAKNVFAEAAASVTSADESGPDAIAAEAPNRRVGRRLIDGAAGRGSTQAAVAEQAVADDEHTDWLRRDARAATTDSDSLGLDNDKGQHVADPSSTSKVPVDQDDGSIVILDIFVDLLPLLSALVFVCAAASQLVRRTAVSHQSLVRSSRSAWPATTDSHTAGTPKSRQYRLKRRLPRPHPIDHDHSGTVAAVDRVHDSNADEQDEQTGQDDFFGHRPDSSHSPAATLGRVVLGQQLDHDGHDDNQCQQEEPDDAACLVAPSTTVCHDRQHVGPHYSPAKSLVPKPRTAAILAPPSPSKRPANVALSAETARLQTVLLQLHLLHRDSAATTAAWHASARELLGRRFAMLAAADIELARAAAVQVERANAAALQRWKGGGIHTLDENVQALDEVLAEGDESEDDEDDDEDGSSLLLLLPGESHKDPALVLDAAWHADCANLTRKLEGWQRQLDILGDGNMNGGGKGDGDGLDGGGTSSLDRILGGCRRLVDDMLAELNVMQQLERDAAEQELAWIRRMNSALDGRESTSRQLSDSISSIGSIDSIGWAAPRAGAIWRVM